MGRPVPYISRPPAATSGAAGVLVYMIGTGRRYVYEIDLPARNCIIQAYAPSGSMLMPTMVIRKRKRGGYFASLRFEAAVLVGDLGKRVRFSGEVVRYPPPQGTRLVVTW